MAFNSGAEGVAGTGEVDTDATIIFDADSATSTGPVQTYGATTVEVECVETSANPLLVWVDYFDDGDWVRIAVGKSKYFRHLDGGIRQVQAKGSGGDAGITWHVAAITGLAPHPARLPQTLT